MIQDPDEVLRRICLAYPWSSECRAIAPMVPSAAENGFLWHGAGGYMHATGKEIPPGTQCESVQLVPIDSIMKPRVEQPATAPTASLGMYTQIPKPMAMSVGFVPFFFHLAGSRTNPINAFL